MQDKKLKIGIFVEDISYGGGLEIVSVRLCKAFLANGIDCSLISLKRLVNKFNTEQCVLQFEYTARQLKNKEIQKLVANSLKEKGYTNIIFQTSAPYSYFSNISFYKKVRDRGIKIFVVFHTSLKSVVIRHYHQGESLIEFLLKVGKTLLYNIPRSYLFFSKSKTVVNSFVTLSNGTSQELLKYFHVKSSVIPNFVEKQDVAVDFTKKEKTFIYIGRMDKEQKNIFYLMNAWKNLKDRMNWKFVIVGSDSKDSKIVQKIQNNNIQIISYADNKKVLEELKKSSVLLLASIYEGFPTVVLEAVSTGNAIITTKFDGFSDEIIHNGENGFVINNLLHSKKFSKAISSLICDEDLLLKMQKKSLELYGEYVKTDVISIWKKEFEK